MALHASWKGSLRISLVSVPVQVYTAAAGTGSAGVSFNQLHATCKSRIQYKKFCPIHGEVTKDEIVSGYEYAKDQYAVIDPEEIQALKTESDKSINVDAFVAPDAIDPIYLSGQAYYVVPDGRGAEKPYALIHKGLAEEGLCGVGQFVIAGKQRLVRLRAMEKVLALDVLHYEDEIKKPAEFEADLEKQSFSASEAKLTKSLLEGMTESDFSISVYKDEYADKVRQLVEAKVEGKEIVTTHAAESPRVINLMDALKESLKLSKAPGKGASAKKPPAKMAPSVRTRGTRKGQSRKSG